jgi:hypothetical protein
MPRLSTYKKSECGICNDVTGRLLCPIDFDWDDLEYVICGIFRCCGLIVLFSVRAKLRNAAPEYDISSSFFLRCLYENEDGDITCPEEGLLKGPLLLCVSFFRPWVRCVFDNHFDFRLTATYSHRLPLPRMKTHHPKSLLGDAMLPLHSEWVAMSLGDRSHMLQPKYVKFFFSLTPLS